MVEGEKLYDIVLRLPLDLRDDPDVISRHPDRRPRQRRPARGCGFPSQQLAKIDPHKPGASYIYRENNRRYIPIKFSVRGRDLASAIAEAQRKVEDPKRRRRSRRATGSSGRASSPRCRRPTPG